MPSCSIGWYTYQNANARCGKAVEDRGSDFIFSFRFHRIGHCSAGVKAGWRWPGSWWNVISNQHFFVFNATTASSSFPCRIISLIIWHQSMVAEISLAPATSLPSTPGTCRSDPRSQLFASVVGRLLTHLSERFSFGYLGYTKLPVINSRLSAASILLPLFKTNNGNGNWCREPCILLCRTHVNK